MKFILKTVAVLFIIFLAIGLLTPSPDEVEEVMNEANATVAADFESQYFTVQQNGTMVDRCVRAGLVADGYLQANDNANYAKWMKVRTSDCKAAGINY